MKLLRGYYTAGYFDFAASYNAQSSWSPSKKLNFKGFPTVVHRMTNCRTYSKEIIDKNLKEFLETSTDPRLILPWEFLI